MKPETLQGLLTARVLWDQAQDLCHSEDKYAASAGLIILQDALELVLYVSLVELGIDEEKSIEKFSFDQIIGELNVASHRVSKSGTLKALNRERVNVKHFGQLAEPATVKNFLDAAKVAIDSLLIDILGRDFSSILLVDFLPEGEARGYLEAAANLISEGKHYEALIEIRKAIFCEIEKDYSIETWKDRSVQDATPFFGGGWKAPHFTKNREYIEKNVTDPFDYIQIDHDEMRLDLIEWGASSQDYWNIWRLTPKVFRFGGSTDWIVEYEPIHQVQAATESNAKYCLDRAISLLVRKHRHKDVAKYLTERRAHKFRVRLKHRQELYYRASVASSVVESFDEGTVLEAEALVTGFDQATLFAKIRHLQLEPFKITSGYVPAESIEVGGGDGQDP